LYCPLAGTGSTGYSSCLSTALTYEESLLDCHRRARKLSRPPFLTRYYMSFVCPRVSQAVLGSRGSPFTSTFHSFRARCRYPSSLTGPSPPLHRTHKSKIMTSAPVFKLHIPEELASHLTYLPPFLKRNTRTMICATRPKMELAVSLHLLVLATHGGGLGTGVTVTVAGALSE